MALRYSFRHLFYGGEIQKERLYKVLKDLDDANGGETTDITGIKQAIGKASGEGAGGILKDVADLKSAVGDASTDNTLVKDVATLETAIGDETTEGSILYRIKQLENG